MGVKQLHSVVDARLKADARVRLDSIAKNLPSNKKPVVVVDGMALVRRLYPIHNDWTGGGEWQLLYHTVGTFVQAFAQANLTLVCFFDGGVDDAKLDEWLSRRRRDLKSCEQHAAQIAQGMQPRVTSSNWVPPMYVSKWIARAFAAHGCRVYHTVGEADKEIALYCSREECAAVLGKDSDFFVLPISGLYLPCDTLQLESHKYPSTVCAYKREDVLSSLGVPEAFLPLFASLVGNDFVDPSRLSHFHTRLVKEDIASGRKKDNSTSRIHLVAQKVVRSCSVAGWKGGSLMTPVLWDALDFEDDLSSSTRLAIESSLRQYELKPTPTCGSNDDARGVSAGLEAKFQTGQLDSAIYTAAAARAIWRGAGIESPGEIPAILVPRPIRAEVYACCVPPAADGTIVVQEHLLYSGQARVGEPEEVRAPVPLVRAEKSWSLSAEEQVHFLLRSLARASANAIKHGQPSAPDKTLLELPARACVACAPIALIVLTVRFLSRNRFIGPASAVALLCQGLVLAQMDRLGRRLPKMEERIRRLVRCPPLNALQASALFLRVSADVVLLNSALGQPLPLSGVWQWFDGPLFHQMHELASSGADHTHLLRGDDVLINLFKRVEHLALGLEAHLAPSFDGAVRAIAERLEEATDIWGGVTVYQLSASEVYSEDEIDDDQ